MMAAVFLALKVYSPRGTLAVPSGSSNESCFNAFTLSHHYNVCNLCEVNLEIRAD